MSINLHSVVRSAITSLHPDEEVIIRHSVGQNNISGDVVPVYSAPVAAKGQFQSMSAEELYHANMAGENVIARKVYLYAEAQPYPAAMKRPLGRSGDYIYKTSEKTWWLITGLAEDFTASGWVCVIAKLQVTAPDLSASPELLA